ncbi:FtsX-like permease family protein [Streptomyces sp. NPDC051907]|uniref:FtsX-like permease family protein n=1 Tax=Streptomyces sp. NPDC051907 TaxID=3155284 RepID=UPI00343E958D
MTMLDERKDAATASPGPSGPAPLSAWTRDLGLGVRFAVAGGREGWIRTLLTAVGVGLGVAVLLAATAVPSLLNNRDQRTVDRTPAAVEAGTLPPSDRTLVVADASVEYRDATIGGWQLRADGANPARPPGVDRFPGPGEMVVSPALKRLLNGEDSELLRERFKPYKLVGTIGEAGLSDPHDLYLYTGSGAITDGKGNANRIAEWGQATQREPMDPVLVILVVLMCVVLLVPVVIFIATAVRFGGERRDRRLAALRLVGADIATTRRAAAGEALFGTLLGLLLGAVFFYGGREFVGSFQVWRVAAFPSDLQPAPLLALAIVLAVPVCAVVVTLVALRSVAIEPLGVVRQSKTRKRRAAWRVAMPVVGVLLLLSTGAGSEGVTSPEVALISIGILLILLGLVTLLPWLVETVVLQMRGGPVAWQLASRRLQLSSAAASRAVSGITVAVAGGIALQMYFVGINDDFTKVTGEDPKRAQVGVMTDFPSGELADRMIKDFRATQGVKEVVGTVDAYAVSPGRSADGSAQTVALTYGSCSTLRELLKLPSCQDGDVFIAYRADQKNEEWVTDAARPGRTLNLNDTLYDPRGAADKEPVLWRIPADARTVPQRTDPAGETHSGVFLTPGSLDPASLPNASTTALIQTDPSVPDAAERVRTTAYAIDPAMRVWTFQRADRDRMYDSLRTALFVAATGTLMLIAASMVVAQIEQLRERKRLLSVLVAFGARRSTLAWSVLWQTAIPVVLGTALAVAGGLGLGWAMLRLIDKPVTEWLLFLPLAGVGAGLVAVVTLLSLPPLWRLMRPDGLRTE